MTVKVIYNSIDDIAFLGTEANFFSDFGAANGIGVYYALRGDPDDCASAIDSFCTADTI